MGVVRREVERAAPDVASNCRPSRAGAGRLPARMSGSRTRRATSARRTRPCRCRSASTRSLPDLLSPHRTRRTRSESPSTPPTGTPGSLAARSRCEPRAAHTWHGLPTERAGLASSSRTWTTSASGAARTSFAPAREDQAGNEASTGTRTDGCAATLRLPARIDTRLAVGLPARDASNAAHRCGRYVERDHSDADVAAERPPDERRRPADRRRRRSRLSRRGRTARALSASASRRPIGEGRFRYVAAGHPQPDVRVPVRRLAADRRPQPPTSTCSVPASSSIRCATDGRLRNGESVLFSGRVRTRPLPLPAS